MIAWNPALYAALSRLGVATSAQLQAALACSQPTVSRLLAAHAGGLRVLGAGRQTRYALPQAILGQPGVQALHWVHEDGRIERWGTLSHLAGGRVHVEGPGFDSLSEGALPWLLSPLRTEGFLGRRLAQRLGAFGLDRQPERWPVEHQLFAALHTPDAPGALVLGEPVAPALPLAVGAEDFDAWAAAEAHTLPAGSSAGGEQAKFLARRADDRPLLVKFSPPRGTPFGERWHDLLHAEALALQVLAEHGVPVAESRVVETAQRTYLASLRFDRIGTRGRRHVVPLHAVHAAFVPEPQQHWAATAEALVRQRRLDSTAAAQVSALRHFGRLIGNSDMHFGNLGLFVSAADVVRGRFTLAPIYDMLPMRWRPDATSGLLDLTPFEPEPVDLQSPARPVAAVYWQRLSQLPAASTGFRKLARTMLERIAP